jgi:hypothetical protein
MKLRISTNSRVFKLREKMSKKNAAFKTCLPPWHDKFGMLHPEYAFCITHDACDTCWSWKNFFYYLNRRLHYFHHCHHESSPHCHHKSSPQNTVWDTVDCLRWSRLSLRAWVSSNMWSHVNICQNNINNTQSTAGGAHCLWQCETPFGENNSTFWLEKCDFSPELWEAHLRL